MKLKSLFRSVSAMLPPALLTVTSCSSTRTSPPAVGAARIDYTKGVPGGTVFQTFKTTATLTAVDQSKRTATLLVPEGKIFTVKVGPEALNFDQVRVGDQVNATVTQKISVRIDKEDAASGDAPAAVAAPGAKGAQPGGQVAGNMQVTGKVIAIDSEKRTATLQFADGTTETLPVRDDVELSRRKVGEKVVFCVLEMIATSLDKTQ